ncbi:MAG: phosphoglycerate kinase, partial [Candidatus Aenigmatarchaeota archaeon]
TGGFQDITKITQAAESIKFAFERHARTVIVASHQGDKGKNETLRNHVEILKIHLPHLKIEFPGVRAGDIIVETVKNKSADVIVLENTRTDEEEWSSKNVEETKIYKMLKQIPNLAVIKDDPASHRKELCSYHIPKKFSEEGIAVIAGPNLERDVELSKRAAKVLEERQSYALLGGKKIADQLELVPQLLEKFPSMKMMLSGLFSVYMEKARGSTIGGNGTLWKESDNAFLPQAKEIMEKYKNRIILPTDYCVADGDAKLCAPIQELRKGKVIDIGPDTILKYMEILASSPGAAVIINGSPGFYEAATNANDPGMRSAAHVYSEAFDENHNHYVMGFGGDSAAIFNRLGFKPQMHSSSGKAFFKRIVYGPYFDCEWLKTEGDAKC